MKLVMVRWRDTTQKLKINLEEVRQESSAIFTVVGYLVEKNQNDIKIVNNYTNDGEPMNCSDVYIIPRGCVEDIIPLFVAGNVRKARKILKEVK